MRAKETTFRELYAGEVVYVTPAFQRSYGHTENAVKRMVAAALAADAPPYFLGALVTRELGIPCVVGVKGLLAAVKDGEEVELDGAAGTVHVIGKEQA